MQVYQKIKKLRQNLGLRQIDMVSGVIDVSFYSRIERGEVKMRAINLIEILRTHDMSIVSFMKDFGLAEPENKIWRDKATDAFLHGNSVELKQIESDPKNLSSLRIKQVISLMIAKLDHKLAEFDPQIKADLKKCIFKVDNWNADLWWIFANSMYIYELNDMNNVIKFVFEKYTVNYDYDIDTLKILAKITVNYMKMCLQDADNKIEFQMAEKFLNKLPAVDEIFLEKCAGAYFTAKQNGNFLEQNRIVSLLYDNGYDYYVDNFMKSPAL
ncbi:hypothetical protein HYQ57_0857 [Lactobacillus crispatus]|uniref:helix-turn-helix domain-containing protein n=1 Tax=Lactobacillus crispatus TaxID=47770 RepID=UPI0018E3FA44|nr:helix-turn-helix transcriptional regulator [Lactobacillus crispatus]MBI1721119.1 hypothetical protein [Lactobacillus crispatus]